MIFKTAEPSTRPACGASFDIPTRQSIRVRVRVSCAHITLGRLIIHTHKGDVGSEAKVLTFDIGVHSTIKSVKQFIVVSYGLEVRFSAAPSTPMMHCRSLHELSRLGRWHSRMI